MKKYDHQEIEKKWQNYWLKNKTFKTTENSNKEKYYVLDMFPYPSGAGLHVGHPLGQTATDIIARKRRHQGYEVLHPMGWDAFGLPAENYAIKTGIHPAITTKENSDTFRRQIQSLGFSYDWDREINTTDPQYYRWTQWIFLQLYKKGLAYEKSMPMSWCPKCKIVAANEEVEQGTHERCGTPVERKHLKQWMLRITEYAERLLNDLDSPNIYIIHGWGSDSQSNWFERARQFLVSKKVRVCVPDFPHTDNPVYKEWKTHFESQFIQLWSQDILIGHSLGGGFMLKYLSENDIQIDKLILVAPTIKDYDVLELKDFYTKTFDYDKIKQSAQKIAIFASDNDQYIPLKDFQFLAQQLDAELILLPQRDHLMDPNFPELFEYLGDIQRSILNWPDKIKAMQRNWIGKSEGLLFTAPVKDTNITIQTFSAHFEAFCSDNFVVIAPDHPFLETLLEGIDNKQEILDFCKELIRKRMERGFEEEKEPEGIFTGRYIIDPVGNGDLPIWIASFALADYGTGIVKCSAHDERDFAFAKKYNIPLKPVLFPKDPEKAEKVKNLEVCCTDMVDGILTEPTEFTGKRSGDVRQEIIEYIEKKGFAKRQTTYKLRDWIFTRQRYWGEPIPIVFDEKGQDYPLDDSELPLQLPEIAKYEPSETGESPLASIDSWVNIQGYITKQGTVKTIQSGDKAPKDTTIQKFKRETSTMPNWAGSSWYWLRFMDPCNEQEFCSKEKEKYWGPVDLYVGGAEHAVLHLLYARFWHKVLYDLGLVSTKEPFKKLLNQGLILAEDGHKMSKSLGNVINPDDIVKKYGADTLRVYEMFMGPFEQSKAWNMNAVEGARKFLDRVWRVSQKNNKNRKKESISSLLHQTIKVVTEHIEEFRFNTAISQLMVLTNELTAQEEISQETLEIFVILLSPFAPHLAEEIWREILGHTETVAYEPWPTWNPEYLIENEVTYAVQINGKVRADFTTPKDTAKEEVVAKAKTLENVSKYLDQGTIIKEIFVPEKIVGFVVK